MYGANFFAKHPAELRATHSQKKMEAQRMRETMLACASISRSAYRYEKFARWEKARSEKFVVASYGLDKNFLPEQLHAPSASSI